MLSLYKVYGDSALLVLNGTSLKVIAPFWLSTADMSCYCYAPSPALWHNVIKLNLSQWRNNIMPFHREAALTTLCHAHNDFTVMHAHCMYYCI